MRISRGIEISEQIELIRRRDPTAAEALNGWLVGLLAGYGDRILPVDLEVAEEWGLLSVPDPLPVIDGLLAATAKIHDLTLATRNVRDIERTGAAWVNPFLKE
jgi:predicted nucleic acid-binding protein